MLQRQTNAAVVVVAAAAVVHAHHVRDVVVGGGGVVHDKAGPDLFSGQRPFVAYLAFDVLLSFSTTFHFHFELAVSF